MNEPASYQKGDRVWLLPDADKREVKSKLPGLVANVLASGRIKVVYTEMRCMLVKTVEPGRVAPRDIPCPDLKERLDGR